MMVVIRIQNSNNSFHVTIPVTPFQCKGGKEKSITPERIRGTAYRDTGSTVYKHTTAFDKMQHKTGIRPAMRCVPVFVFWGDSAAQRASQCEPGGAAALGSPYGGAGERTASLRGRRQWQIWEMYRDCSRVPSQSRLPPAIESGDPQRCGLTARVAGTPLPAGAKSPSQSRLSAVPALP